ncbi:tRNA 2-selenouridine(34) synthase MnmH [Parasedimentitalea psychrophila]|uniref:tRNA 2-selenouridine(34) synthase MnmH n=1 Tax=Parasedimentitalea psychrophila TaxID=2997337 RepID=A0A9Y2KZR3_9RHOB|nr:tRNA 2-selenouridine(34) synthase MnmH [Parasedimentitalea psychrophila]WIY25315.1 tRNA 2-selenouridine(34) synthase MnmH [Parasedimentitalea psychrophila]
MALTFTSLIDLLDHSYDSVIDVRSPGEFAEDHLPGAINLPVLDNEERAQVGTIYVQKSRFLARKLGAAMVFRNTARHVETALAEKDGGWQPLVYCWRGGQRSGSFTWLLQQIGWRAEVIEGGYQTYRRLVKSYLYDTPLAHQLVALDGYTGTAKTDLLKLVQTRGVQVLDLEGLANHRGSLLGGMNGPQPSQKAFESELAAQLARLDTARPVLVEAESSKIGDRIIPPSLWTAMKAAPRIQVAAPVAARSRYLVRAYDDILSDADKLCRKLEPLRAHRSNAVVDLWFELIAAGDKAALTEALMVQHYDPSYAKSRQTAAARVLAEVQVAELDAEGLAGAADQITKLMQRQAAQ